MYVNKKQILECFLANIFRISNKKYQIRIWIKGLGPECHNFDDAVCDFFEEGNSIIEHYQDFGITEHQYRLLKKFREVFDTFCDDNDYPEEFIDTLEWDNITKLAQEILIAFNYQKDSQSFS